MNNNKSKGISYIAIMNTLSRIENVENIKAFNSNKKRLTIFETIICSQKHNVVVNNSLFDDIKQLIKEEIVRNN